MRFPNEATKRYYLGAYGGRATDAVIADYTIGALSVEKMRAITERLDADAAFRAMAMPLIRALRRPIVDPRPGDVGPRARTPEERATEWKRFEAMTADDPAIELKTAALTSPRRRRPGPVRRTMIGGALILIVFGAPAFMMISAAKDRAVAVLQRKANGFEEQGMLYREGRALTRFTPNSRIAETTPVETTTVDLPDDSRAILQPTTRLTYPGVKGLSMVAALDGEAVFEIAEGSFWSVQTNGGLLTLMPGRYAIRSVPHSKEARVSIDSGMVTAGPADSPKSFGPGFFVHATNKGATVTGTKDPTGFPPLSPRQGGSQ